MFPVSYFLLASFTLSNFCHTYFLLYFLSFQDRTACKFTMTCLGESFVKLLGFFFSDSSIN